MSFPTVQKRIEKQMTEATTVSREFDAAAGIATLTFNRPKVFNALDIAMAAAFDEAVAWLTTLDGLRCVVLTGAGKAFMAGGDVGSFAADPDTADRTLSLILKHMHPALLTLRALDAPVLAAVNGTAAGAGFSLVAAADYVVATRSAKLILAYDKLGTTPDCSGTWCIPRKIGRHRTFELMLTGRPLATAEAADWGLVNEIAEDDSFADTARAAAQRIAAGPTRAFGLFKRLMEADQPLAAQLELERASFMQATATQDFRNAARAFVEKQAPVFSGK